MQTKSSTIHVYLLTKIRATIFHLQRVALTVLLLGTNVYQMEGYIHPITWHFKIPAFQCMVLTHVHVHPKRSMTSLTL